MSDEAPAAKPGSWLPPDDESAANDRERALAEERARGLAVAAEMSRRSATRMAHDSAHQPTWVSSGEGTTEEASTVPEASATEEASTVPEASLTEEASTVPEATPAVEQTPAAEQALTKGWVPGEEAPAPAPSESEARAPVTEPAQMARQSPESLATESSHAQATSPWLPVSERTDAVQAQSGSPWLPAPKPTISDPAPAAETISDPGRTAERESPTTVTEAVVAEPGLGSTVAPTASQRQISAVESYCRELCTPESASVAAAETLRSFAGADDLDLLRHTRAVAAKHAVQPHSRLSRRALRRSARAGHCESTPGLLAAKANGELDERGRNSLERHLDSCATCQAAEVRGRRADRAFAGVTRLALPLDDPAMAPATAPAAPPAQEAHATDDLDKAWMPVAAGALSDQAIPVEAAAAAGPESRPPRSRRGLVPVVASESLRPWSRRAVLVVAGAATAIAAIVALAVVLSSGSSKHPAVARATTPVTTPAAVQPAHRAAPRSPARKKPAPKPSTPSAAPATPAAPAAASSPTSTATPSSSSSAPAASSPSAASSPPASSAPAPSPAPSPSPSPPSSSQPPVSIQQPSLGSANAPQGVGK